jgi:hypothetical protein
MKKFNIAISALFLGGMVFMVSSCRKDKLNEFQENPAIVSPDVAECTACATERAFPNEKGIVKSTTIDGISITYEEINGQAVYEGDIILSDGELNQAGKIAGAGKRLLGNRWPGNKVYYTVESSLSGDSRITGGIKTWEDNTNIDFVPRTSQANYVTFRVGDGCSSSIGMQGGQQFINLGSGCSTGNVRHEIGHTIGLFHEHTRADRNSYVIIHLENVEAGKEHNFNIYNDAGNVNFDQGVMDFGSIMLYDSYAFSKNGNATITRLNGTTFTSQRTNLSAADLVSINIMYPPGWKLLTGAANDIGASAGATYVIGATAESGGYGIYKWTGSDWTKIPGGAIRVDVENNGNPWVVNSVGQIFRRDGSSWTLLPGRAKDIGIGAEGSVYVIGTTAESGGYGIYKWSGSDWTKLNGAAVRVTVDNTGTPWVVNSVGNIYKRSGSSWQQLPGFARDIGAGPNGNVYIIGTTAVGGGHNIYQWSGSDWVEVPGGAEFVDVGSGGSPWVVNDAKGIFKK